MAQSSETHQPAQKGASIPLPRHTMRVCVRQERPRIGLFDRTTTSPPTRASTWPDAVRPHNDSPYGECGEETFHPPAPFVGR